MRRSPELKSEGPVWNSMWWPSAHGEQEPRTLLKTGSQSQGEWQPVESEREVRERMTSGLGHGILPKTDRYFHKQVEIIRKRLDSLYLVTPLPPLPPRPTSSHFPWWYFPQDGRKLHQSLSSFYSLGDQTFLPPFIWIFRNKPFKGQKSKAALKPFLLEFWLNHLYNMHLTSCSGLIRVFPTSKLANSLVTFLNYKI